MLDIPNMGVLEVDRQKTYTRRFRHSKTQQILVRKYHPRPDSSLRKVSLDWCCYLPIEKPRGDVRQLWQFASL